MAKIKLWPLVRKFYGHVQDALYYVDWPRGRQTVTPDYFEYRRWRWDIKPRWPRGNFFNADRFWGAQSIEWRQKWKAAVKKHGLTGYSLWMKEALYHMNQNWYAPEEPSESGGYANPPLVIGKRLKPCLKCAAKPCEYCEERREKTPLAIYYRMRIKREDPEGLIDGDFEVWQDGVLACVWMHETDVFEQLIVVHEFNEGEVGWKVHPVWKDTGAMAAVFELPFSDSVGCEYKGEIPLVLLGVGVTEASFEILNYKWSCRVPPQDTPEFPSPPPIWENFDRPLSLSPVGSRSPPSPPARRLSTAISALQGPHALCASGNK